MLFEKEALVKVKPCSWAIVFHTYLCVLWDDDVLKICKAEAMPYRLEKAGFISGNTELSFESLYVRVKQKSSNKSRLL